MAWLSSRETIQKNIQDNLNAMGDQLSLEVVTDGHYNTGSHKTTSAHTCPASTVAPTPDNEHSSARPPNQRS